MPGYHVATNRTGAAMAVVVLAWEIPIGAQRH